MFQFGPVLGSRADLRECKTVFVVHGIVGHSKGIVVPRPLLAFLDHLKKTRIFSFGWLIQSIYGSGTWQRKLSGFLSISPGSNF